jgi:L-alanine-DL-glutamate epimerase-like enolase superfamily enzyme
MRITGIRTVLYEYELTRPLGDVNLPDGFRHGADLAVFVDTDEGLTGTTIGSGGAAGPIAFLAELLTGRDPLAVRALWQLMVAAAFKGGKAGSIGLAVSAIDCALWDLRAKAHGVPLFRELGADSGRVPAYASGLDSPLDDAELDVFYRRMAAQGIATGKLKVGRDREDDLRRLGIMHDALATSGRPPLLAVDANEFWSPKQAVQRIAELEREHELAWVEEPARRWDHAGLRQVSDHVNAPVATGENLQEVREFVPLLVNNAVDLVQVSVSTTGVTGALQIGELAAAFDRPVALMNCPGRFAAHVAAALPNHTMMEVIDAGRDAALTGQPPVQDGHIVLSDDVPGSGVEFDPERLEALRVTAASGTNLANAYRRATDAGMVG